MRFRIAFYTFLLLIHLGNKQGFASYEKDRDLMEFSPSSMLLATTPCSPNNKDAFIFVEVEDDPGLLRQQIEHWKQESEKINQEKNMWVEKDKLLENELGEWKTRYAKIKEDSTNETQLSQSKIKEMQETINKLEQEKNKASGMIEKTVLENTDLNSKLHQLNTQYDVERENLTIKIQALEREENTLRDLTTQKEHQASALRQRIAALEDEKGQIKVHMTESTQKQEQEKFVLQGQLQQLQAERDSLSQEKGALEGQLKTVETKLETVKIFKVTIVGGREHNFTMTPRTAGHLSTVTGFKTIEEQKP